MVLNSSKKKGIKLSNIPDPIDSKFKAAQASIHENQ